MATLKLAEPVVRATIEKLKQGMAARCAAINAEFADDVTITPPGDDGYVRWGIHAIAHTPLIVVAQIPGEEESEGEGPHSFIWVGLIGVFITDSDHDLQRAGDKLQRLRRAVCEVIWDDEPREALAGSAFHMEFVRDDPGPTEPFETDAGEQGWHRSHLVVFRARQTEG